MPVQASILITGASGFVGKHLVKEAVNQGFRVYALVRPTSNTTGMEDATLVYADIREYDSLLKAFSILSDNGIALDYVVHAAALTKSNTKTDFFDANYKGTYHLYQAMAQARQKPKRVVFVSSLAACGPEKFNARIEKDSKAPVSLYGESKLKAEDYIIHSSGLPYIILRPTAVYGPGEKDLFSVFQLIRRGLNPIMGFHQQQLTFIYVKDLVSLILSALHSEQENKIYFATDGAVYTKTALPQAIAQAMNRKVLNVKIPLPLVRTIAVLAQYTAAISGKVSALNMEKYRELVAGSWDCNMESTFRDLHYVPQYPLERGIAETTQWYKQNNWIH